MESVHQMCTKQHGYALKKHMLRLRIATKKLRLVHNSYKRISKLLKYDEIVRRFSGTRVHFSSFFHMFASYEIALRLLP